MRADPKATEADAVLRRDRELLGRWRAGDAGAGVDLLDHYAGYVRHTIRRQGVTGDAEIEEFWQDLVLRLMQQLPELAQRLRSSFSGYLAWQVRDLMRSWHRQRRRAAVAEPELETNAGEDPSTRTAFWEAMQQCAGKLPEREKAVFQHRFLDGLGLGEVAERVGSNANAVAQAVFRLIRRLRTCLAAKGFDGPGDLT
ncbi:MAG TPA: sigma-70 family RNA polymerase sigma factor [Planctomycetota bacterium]|nr:sigma-70 family RNA polymerase sigma factor [Planctomycetota bacterium]